MLQGVPNLLLPLGGGIDGEGHQLLQRHAVLGIDVEQIRRHRGEAQTLFHDRRRDKMARCDVFLAHAEVPQRLEGAELIERMQPDPLVIFGNRVVLRDAAFADDARNHLRLCHALLLDQKLESAIAAAAGGHLEHAGLVAVIVDYGTHVETLQQSALCDALRQLLDRDAGLDAPHIRLAEHQLVEGNIARGRQCDLLNGLCHLSFSATGGREPLSRPPTRREARRSPLTLFLRDRAAPADHGGESPPAAYRRPAPAA